MWHHRGSLKRRIYFRLKNLFQVGRLLKPQRGSRFYQQTAALRAAAVALLEKRVRVSWRHTQYDGTGIRIGVKSHYARPDNPINPAYYRRIQPVGGAACPRLVALAQPMPPLAYGYGWFVALFAAFCGFNGF